MPNLNGKESLTVFLVRRNSVDLATVDSEISKPHGAHSNYADQVAFTW